MNLIKRESPRLIWEKNFLNKIGIKTELKNNTIKIHGNPNITLDKKIIIKNFLKDHRVFMTSVIAAKSFGEDGLFMIRTRSTPLSKFFKNNQKLRKIILKFTKKIKIAIDSPAAAGAGTVAKNL